MNLKKQFSILLFIVSSLSVFGQQPVKNVLLEEFSTAPCGFCPDGGLVAEEIIKKQKNVFTFTHHAGFGTDSMTINESKTIANEFTCFAPGACLDRMDYPIPVYTYPNYIAVSRQKWDSLCYARSKDSAYCGVNITNNYNQSTRKLNSTIDVHFAAQPHAGDLRINLLIIEDSVVGVGHGYDQKSYFNNDASKPSLYHKGDTIKGYIHRHVVRYMPAGTWGQSGVIPTQAEAGKTYSYTVSNLDIPTKWKDKDLQVLAFVSYYNADKKKRTVLNSNETSIFSSVTAGMNETLNNPTLIGIYPNPASKQITVLFDANKKDYSIELYNSAGQKVLTQTGKQGNAFIGSASLNTSALANGIYLVKVKNGEGVSMGKVMVE